MMITALVCGTLLGLGAVFAAIRLVKGPTQIDRAVAALAVAVQQPRWHRLESTTESPDPARARTQPAAATRFCPGGARR